jgi:hypothetical protein
MIAYKLSVRSLKALTAGKILAVRVPHFLNPCEACEIAEAVAQSCHFRFTGPGFTGLGPGSFALPQALDDYAASTAEIEKILRTPCERLEAALGRNLQCPVLHGCTRLRRLTVRRYDRTFEARPHQDEDSYRYEWAAESQLGISIGLVSPTSGGKIRLWNRCELDESKIPPYDLAVACDVGELLIRNARKIHAIEPIKDGARMSISGFLSINQSGCQIWS